jgi:hypothetical protein
LEEELIPQNPTLNIGKIRFYNFNALVSYFIQFRLGI